MKISLKTGNPGRDKIYPYILLQMVLMLVHKFSRRYELLDANGLSILKTVMIIISAFILIQLQLVLTRGKLKERRGFVKYPLNSSHFMYNLLIVAFTSVWIVVTALIFYPQNAGILEKTVWIPVMIAPALFTKWDFVRKINLKAFDEREEMLCLKAERIAGLSAAYSCIWPFLTAYRTEPYFTYLLAIPVVVYYMMFNLASWRYFRVDEKENAK